MGSHELSESLMGGFNRFIGFIRRGEPAGAVEEFGKIGSLLRRGRFEVPEKLLSSCVDAFIDLFVQLGRYDCLLEVAESSERAIGTDREWTLARGEALFNLGRFDEAREVLEPLTQAGFDEPMACHLMACIAERHGEEERSRRLFERAHTLDPEEYSIPSAVTEREAIAVYRQCMKELPEPVRRYLEDIPIYVDALPSDELVRAEDPPLDPLVLGVFLGQAAGERTGSWPDEQPRIVLFHRNIGKLAGDPPSVRNELRNTLFHEVGHALGLEENELEEMGLA